MKHLHLMIARLLRKRSPLVLGVWMVLFGAISLVMAQSELQEVQIQNVDFSQFPMTEVFVAPRTEGGGELSDIDANAFRLKENGVLAPIDEVTKEDVGSLIAILLDASGSINSAGATGKLRREEAIEIIDELVMSGKWLDKEKRNTYVMLLAPIGADDYKILQTWTNDYVSIHNQAYTYNYKGQKTDTPLYAMLIEVINRMDDAPGADIKQKSILVLSDGIDRTSAEEIGDVIGRANNKHITIMSVKLGPEHSGQAKNLRRMSRLTNGLYTVFTGVDALSRMYDTLKSQGSQYRLVYQSKIKQAGLHQIQAGVDWNGEVVWSQPEDVSLTLEPPEVHISSPEAGMLIERNAERWDEDPLFIEPRTIEVISELSWPDEHPREIVRATYLVDGVAIDNLSTLAPYLWNIAALPKGSHALAVEVEDTLGMISLSDPVPITIDISIPPAPTLAPEATVDVDALVEKMVAGEVRRRTSSLTMFSAFALLLALLALLLAVVVFIRRPKIVRDMTATLAGVVKEATEIFIPRRGVDASVRKAKAYLIPVDGAGQQADPIPIRHQTVSIGRDPSRAQIVLANRSVSRLHASIVEDEDNVFRLRDEGSTGGTYLNYEMVPPEGMILTPGDEIQIGRVRLTFQLHLPDAPSTQPSDSGVAGMEEPDARAPQDQTSPFIADADMVEDSDITEPFSD